MPEQGRLVERPFTPEERSAMAGGHSPLTLLVSTTLIACMLIATDCCPSLDVLADLGLQLFFAGRRNGSGYRITTPLSHAQGRLFAGSPTATAATLSVVMLVVLLATAVELIHLNHALQRGQVLAKGLPDPL